MHIYIYIYIYIYTYTHTVHIYIYIYILYCLVVLLFLEDGSFKQLLNDLESSTSFRGLRDLRAELDAMAI